jgi:hypothetical protein
MRVQDDSILKTIRDIRHQISVENDHDAQKIVDYYLDLQKNIM